MSAESGQSWFRPFRLQNAGHAVQGFAFNALGVESAGLNPKHMGVSQN